MKKGIIRITSRLGGEFDSEVTIGNDRYLVQTESGEARKPVITTRVYLGGQVLLTRKRDYGDIIEEPDLELRLRELMQRQHKLVIGMIQTEKLKKTRSVSDYLGEVKDCLRTKNKKRALVVLNEALEQYHDDPFLLSYSGYLEAAVNKSHQPGIDICHRAIEILKKRVPFGDEFFYPVFYLNLGRAYLAAGRKREAVDAFNRGIGIDKENSELLWELKKLGVRRKPVIPVLKRSNPINRYMGKLLHSLKK